MKQRLKGLLALVLSLTMVLGLMTCAWGANYTVSTNQVTHDGEDYVPLQAGRLLFAGDVILEGNPEGSGGLFVIKNENGEYVGASDNTGKAMYETSNDYPNNPLPLRAFEEYEVPSGEKYLYKESGDTEYQDSDSWDVSYIHLVPAYTVTFDKNAEDATGTMVDQIFEDGVEQELSRNIFTREGYDFKGWKDDAGVSYADEKKITVTSDITLYAQWEEETPSVVTHTVTFDGNGATYGTMTDLVVAEGDKVTLTKNAFERDGYTFADWNTKADGTGDDYADGAEFTLTSDITLYAQWTENSNGEDPEQEPPVNPGMPYFPPKKPEVESAKTFDSGIASAVVVTILSATGSAWLAKKKD